jgi:Raf kinase inhibitor-like YbhB/YbcL family protein
MYKKLFLLAFVYWAPTGATMQLISPAFSENETIPTTYTCDGENISPMLVWSDAPERTESFALIVDDPDAMSQKPWIHWIVFNIPSTIDHINENQGQQREEAPFTYGATDFNGAPKWGGPCPPKGVHHYHFSLYALDTTLDLPAGATKNQLLEAMHGHILEQATLIGTYHRHTK